MGSFWVRLRAPRVLLALLFFFLFSSLAAAVVDVDPKQVSGATIRATTNWDFNFPGALPSKVEFDTYVFSSTMGAVSYINPATDCSVPCGLSRDAKGNDVLRFTFTPGASSMRITLLSRIDTDYSRFAGSNQIPDDFSYLQESAHVKMTPDIVSLASSITAGAKSDEEKITRVADWVHRAVKYDGPGYRDVLLTSTEVLAQRAGKCSEFSHLAAAMLRSLGIPTRFVAGLVYSGEDWSPHAWLESKASGKWWPLDPTFGEALVVDGTHAAFARAADQDGVVELLTRHGGTGSPSFTRQPTLVTLENPVNFSNRIALRLSLPTDTLGPGSIQTASVLMRNLMDAPVGAPVALSTTGDVNVPDGKEKLVFLPANQVANTSFNLVLPSSLNPAFVYTYPVLVHALGARDAGNLTAQSTADTRTEVNVRFSDLSYQYDGTNGVLIKVTLANNGNAALKNATLTTDLDGQTLVQPVTLDALKSTQLVIRLIAPAGDAHGTLTLTAPSGKLVQPFTMARPTPTPALLPTALPSVKIPTVPSRATDLIHSILADPLLLIGLLFGLAFLYILYAAARR